MRGLAWPLLCTTLMGFCAWLDFANHQPILGALMVVLGLYWAFRAFDLYMTDIRS